jgi:7-cyano-7-deazaguanine synthase
MKSVVLLSAGLDSTVNLFEAHHHGEVLLALTFDYGQRAAAQEIKKSKVLCETLKIPHQVIPLDFFKTFLSSSLINRDLKVPDKNDVKIDELNTSQRTAKSVWVPNRNGIFLNIAAGIAENLKAEFIIPGFNIEEAATFPDNTDQFLKALDVSLSFSTANGVKTKCFTTALEKTQIVKRGLELQVPFANIWPCYHDHEKWCGKCESCLRAKRAFESNSLHFF